MKVYLLRYKTEDRDVIAVYSTAEKAEEARKRIYDDLTEEARLYEENYKVKRQNPYYHSATVEEWDVK